MHCVEESEDDDDVLMASGSCFADLTRVWVVEEVTENSTLEDCLEIFVPFVSEELRRGMGSESCGVGYLAGIVTFQVFLLSLCLNFDRGVGRSELEKDLKECMVQMISGFQSYHFFDIILKMLLLEPNLPVTSLLDPEDAVILHETLTEVVITSVEKLFLQPENGTSQQSLRLKNIAINWLFLVENAMETARRNKDLEKTSCYMNMFSSSRVQTYLIDFVSNQGELMKDPATLRNSSPKGLIKWLLSVEKQGQRVFECDHSRNSAKDVIQGSRAVLNLKTFNETQKNPDEKNPISNPLGADRKEKFNQDTDMDDTMELLNSSSTRKRKEERHREGQTAVKLFKHRHNLHENSKSKFQPFHLSESVINKTEVDVADMEL